MKQSKKIVANSEVYWPSNETVLQGIIQIQRSAYLIKNKRVLKQVIKVQCSHLQKKLLEALNIK